MKQEEFVSLYDFLGRPAGSQLGKDVWEAAKSCNQPTAIKEVANPKYTGKIVMYQPEFLKNYFNGTKN
jgi:hypothetical protein